MGCPLADAHTTTGVPSDRCRLAELRQSAALGHKLKCLGKPLILEILGCWSELMHRRSEVSEAVGAWDGRVPKIL